MATFLVLGFLSCKYDDWTLHHGICYKPVPFPSNEAIFAKAHGACREQLDMDASLVMPKTQVQFDFISYSFQYLQMFWLGLIFINNTWMWLDESRVNSFTPWQEENITMFHIDYRTCIVISAVDGMPWTTLNCDKEAEILCQMEAIETYEKAKGHCDCEDQEASKYNKTFTNTFDVKDLILDRSTLSSYIRGKTSATDDRKSSACIGWLGIMLITFIIGFIVSLDMMPPKRIHLRYLKKLHKRLAHRFKQAF